MIFPEVTTPKDLAQHLGWPERRVRRIAKALGACLVWGSWMRFTNDDVLKITKSLPTPIEDRRTFQRCGSSIYFITTAGFIKIGWSRTWQRRIASLQTSSPTPIETLLVLEREKAVEKLLHQQFAEHRVSGEWFTDHPDIRSYIEGRQGECRYRAGLQK